MPTVSQYELQILVTTKKRGNGIELAGKEVNNFGKRLNNSLDLITKSGAAALAAGLTFKKAFAFSKEGAQIKQLSQSFDLLNERVIQNPKLLADMRAAVRGTVTDAELMQGVLKLTAGTSNELAQNMANATPRLLEIAKAAGKLNPTLGDTSFLYDSISTGIKRSSPLILDNLGIVVKVGEANEKYAKSLGKSVDQLSAEEKQMALLNDTLEAGDQLIQQVGGSVDAQSDSWERLETQIKQTADTLKVEFAERIAPVVDAAAGTNADAVEQMISDNLAAAESIEDLVEEAQKLDEAFGLFLGFGTRVTGTTAEVEAGMVDVTSMLAEASDSFEEFEEVYEMAFGVGARNKLAFLIGDLREYFFLQKAMGVNWQQIAPDIDALNDLMTVQEEAVEDLTPRWEFLTEKMELTDDQMEALIGRFGDVNKATHFLEAAYSDAGQAADEYGITAEELAEIEKERAKASEEAADEAAAALEEHLALLEEIAARQGDYFTQALNAEAGTGLFNESLDALGEQMIVTGGRTADQTRLLQEAKEEYGKLERSITDALAAPELLGLEADKVAEKIEGWRARQAELNPLIERLSNIQGTANTRLVEATINMDAVNQALFNAADAAGADAEQLAILGHGLGLFSEDAANAALKAALIRQKIDELATGFKEGETTLGDIRGELEEFIANVEAMDDPLGDAQKKAGELVTTVQEIPDVAKIDFETNILTLKEEKLFPAQEAVDELSTDDQLARAIDFETNALELHDNDLIPFREAIDAVEQDSPYVADFESNASAIEQEMKDLKKAQDKIDRNITITITTKYKTEGSPPSGGIGGHRGLDLIVPTGFHNDSFGPIWAESGERVQITRPGGASSAARGSGRQYVDNSTTIINNHTGAAAAVMQAYLGDLRKKRIDSFLGD